MRARPILFWVLMSLTIICGAACLVSYYGIEYSSVNGATRNMEDWRLNGGRLEISRTSLPSLDNEDTAKFMRDFSSSTWRFGYRPPSLPGSIRAVIPTSGGTQIVSLNSVPLVPPTMLLAVASATLIVVRRLRRRKQRAAGQCFECGYNLTGNVTGVCPECGTNLRAPWATGQPESPEQRKGGSPES